MNLVTRQNKKKKKREKCEIAQKEKVQKGPT